MGAFETLVNTGVLFVAVSFELVRTGRPTQTAARNLYRKFLQSKAFQKVLAWVGLWGPKILDSQRKVLKP